MNNNLIIDIPRPDDWHCHFRDGAYLQRTVPDCAKYFARAIAMPNLSPAVTTLSALLAYQERLRAAIPANIDFTPLMTLYLSTSLTAETIKEARKQGVLAAKLYPKNATTNAAQGVEALEALYPVFAAMEAEGMLLLVHGEVADPNI